MTDHPIKVLTGPYPATNGGVYPTDATFYLSDAQFGATAAGDFGTTIEALAGASDPTAVVVPTTWRNGTGAPSNGLGVDGDFYLNTTNGDVYKRASGVYTVVANISGPVGATGAAGATGATGAAGATGATGAGGSASQWRNGTGAPSNGLGANGDYYLNNTNGDVYKRVSGAYGSPTANIKGATTIPTGGTTGQLVAKASNTDFDIAFVNAAALSNVTPILAAGAGSPGSSIAAARDDHQHPSEVFDLAALVRPPGAVADTYDRHFVSNTDQAIGASGFLRMYLIAIKKNTVVTTINFQISGTAANTPTHQWAGLFDSGPAAIALTADHTTAVYGTNSTMSMDLSAPYTTGSLDALYYVGLCVVATTQPTVYGYATAPNFESAITPKFIGNAATGLTIPPSLPVDYSVTKSGWTSISPYAYIWLT